AAELPEEVPIGATPRPARRDHGSSASAGARAASCCHVPSSPHCGFPTCYCTHAPNTLEKVRREKTSPDNSPEGGFARIAHMTSPSAKDPDGFVSVTGPVLVYGQRIPGHSQEKPVLPCGRAFYPVQVALLAAVYFGAAKLGLSMAFVAEQVTAV